MAAEPAAHLVHAALDRCGWATSCGLHTQIAGLLELVRAAHAAPTAGNARYPATLGALLREVSDVSVRRRERRAAAVTRPLADC